MTHRSGHCTAGTAWFSYFTGTETPDQTGSGQEGEVVRQGGTQLDQLDSLTWGPFTDSAFKSPAAGRGAEGTGESQWFG